MQLERLLPIVGWARSYDRVNLRPDAAAGLTVAAMLVPQSMAYALLAGLPPEVGLYAATFPLLAYSIFGSSNQLSVGPTAITSIMTASALGPLVAENEMGYVTAAAVLAMMIGAVHILLGTLRLGRLVNVLSHSVLVGFTAAAALIIGFSQIKHVLGITTERRTVFLDTVGETLANVGGTHLPTVALGVIGIVILRALKKLAPTVPGALVIVVLSVCAVEAFGLRDGGVKVVGDIPDAFAAFSIPSLEAFSYGALVLPAIIITLVGFVESFAVATVYATRNGDELDPNRELIGLGFANTVAGLFGGYPVTGGFSRTAVNAVAGARTPLALIFTSLMVLVTLAFFTPILELLPNAALGAIIISAVIGLVDVAEIASIARSSRVEFANMVAVFVATLLLGLEIGVGIALAASVLTMLARRFAATPAPTVTNKPIKTTER